MAVVVAALLLRDVAGSMSLRVCCGLSLRVRWGRLLLEGLPEFVLELVESLAVYR